VRSAIAALLKAFKRLSRNRQNLRLCFLNAEILVLRQQMVEQEAAVQNLKVRLAESCRINSLLIASQGQFNRRIDALEAKENYLKN
jgi:hypothetical protein